MLLFLLQSVAAISTQRLFREQLNDCQFFVQGSLFDLSWLSQYASDTTPAVPGTIYSATTLDGQSVYWNFCSPFTFSGLSTSTSIFAVADLSTGPVALGGGPESPGHAMGLRLIMQERVAKKGFEHAGLVLTYFNPAQSNPYLTHLPNEDIDATSLSLEIYCDATLTANPTYSSSIQPPLV